MAAEALTEQLQQAHRIEKALSGLMHPSQYKSAYQYTDDGVSFRIDEAATGRILCEAYRPTRAKEIAAMSDEVIETRLKEMFANTHRLLNGH